MAENTQEVTAEEAGPSVEDLAAEFARLVKVVPTTAEDQLALMMQDTRAADLALFRLIVDVFNEVLFVKRVLRGMAGQEPEEDEQQLDVGAAVQEFQVGLVNGSLANAVEYLRAKEQKRLIVPGGGV